jgi:hypothetical protein
MTLGTTRSVRATVKARMLGASLHITVECTRSDPRQSGFQIRNTLAHAEGMSVVFCRKSKVSRISKQRLWQTHGVETRITTQAEVRRWRGHTGHQPKVVTSVRHAVAPHWTNKSGVLM